MWFTRRQEKQEKHLIVGAQIVEGSGHDTEQGRTSLEKQGVATNLTEEDKGDKSAIEM